MEFIQNLLKLKYVKMGIATVMMALIMYLTSGMYMENKNLILILLYIQSLVIIYFDAKIKEVKSRMRKQLLNNGKKVYTTLKATKDEKIDKEGIETIMKDLLYFGDDGEYTCEDEVNTICEDWDKKTPKGLDDGCRYGEGECTVNPYASEMLCNREKLTWCGRY